MLNKKTEMLSKRNYYSAKSAAMFGLDARIALAIFGALSVITGAALYKAIQQAEVTRVIGDLTGISKATEQYVLDTGQDLPMTGGAAQAVHTEQAFLKSTVKGWKGPYLPYTYLGDATAAMSHPKYTNTMVQYFSDDPYPDSESVVKCQTGKHCYYWSRITNVHLSILNAIDEQIDDGNELTGNVRVWHAPDATIGSIGMKSIKTFKVW